jgi:glutamate racemase
MLAGGIDTVVLGCTHYPFVIPLIEKIVGPSVRVIDPAPAVARQVGRVLQANDLLQSDPSRQGEITYLTTGGPARFQKVLSQLMVEQGAVIRLDWSVDLVHPSLQPHA